MKFTKHKTRAFGLIEMSYLLLVFATLSIGTLILINFAENNTPKLYHKTEVKLDAIELALVGFLAENGRLPCPSSLTLDPSDPNFGRELLFQDESNDIANCDEAASSGGINAIQVEGKDYIFHGGLPVRTLGLRDEFAWDNWSTKFEYVVQTPFINNHITNPNASAVDKQDSSTDFAYFSFRSQDPGLNTSDDDLMIIDPQGATVSQSAVYFLLSHGANQNFGFTIEGEALSQRNNNLEEKNSIYTESNERVYVEYASPGESFDDITRFKNRDEITNECNNLLGDICTSRWSIQP